MSHEANRKNGSVQKVRVTLSGSRDNCLIISRDARIDSRARERRKSSLNIDTLHIWYSTHFLRNCETSKNHFNNSKSFNFVFRWSYGHMTCVLLFTKSTRSCTCRITETLTLVRTFFFFFFLLPKMAFISIQQNTVDFL